MGNAWISLGRIDFTGVLGTGRDGNRRDWVEVGMAGESPGRHTGIGGHLGGEVET